MQPIKGSDKSCYNLTFDLACLPNYFGQRTPFPCNSYCAPRACKADSGCGDCRGTAQRDSQAGPGLQTRVPLTPSRMQRCALGTPLSSRLDSTPFPPAEEELSIANAKPWEQPGGQSEVGTPPRSAEHQPDRCRRQGHPGGLPGEGDRVRGPAPGSGDPDDVAAVRPPGQAPQRTQLSPQTGAEGMEGPMGGACGAQQGPHR